MKSNQISLWTHLGFGISLGAVALASWFLLEASARSTAATSGIARGMETLRAVDQVNRQVDKAEDAKRIYLLAGAERFLAERDQAVLELRAAVTHLEALTATDAEQKRRGSSLDGLVKQYVETSGSELNRTEAATQLNGPVASAPSAVEPIRTLLTAVQVTENQALALRRAEQSDQKIPQAIQVMAIALSLLIVLGYIAALMRRKTADPVEHAFSSMIENLPGAAFRLVSGSHASQHGTFTFVTRSVFQLFGTQPASLLRDASAFWDYVLEEDRPALQAAMDRSALRLQSLRHDFRITHASGEVRWLRTSANVVTDADGRHVWEGYWSDVTREKNLAAPIPPPIQVPIPPPIPLLTESPVEPPILETVIGADARQPALPAAGVVVLDLGHELVETDRTLPSVGSLEELVVDVSPPAELRVVDVPEPAELPVVEAPKPAELPVVHVPEPAELPVVAAPEPSEPPTENKNERKRVLLAGDHSPDRFSLIRQIKVLGYAVEHVNDRDVAFFEWKSGRFGIVLADCNRPEMNAYELARGIREAEKASGAPRVPIVGCMNEGGDVNACLAAGMDTHLQSPIEPNALAKKLDRWLPIPRIAAPVDPTVLAGVLGDDAEAQKEMLRMFLRITDEDAARLSLAVETSNFPEIVLVCHRIRRSGLSAGADALAAAADVVGRAGSAEDAKAVESGMEGFRHELERLDVYREESR
ncbi:MAG: CHASE3 domain-containing protein [Vicinamibacteria bacterium]